MQNYYESSLGLSDKCRMLQSGIRPNRKAKLTKLTGITNISNFISNVLCNIQAYGTFSVNIFFSIFYGLCA